MEKKDQIQRYWQNWDKGDVAKLIDDYWVSAEADWRELLAANVKEEFGTNVSLLEVGCGSGLIYKHLLQHQIVTPASYAGGDVSHKILSIARNRFPGSRFSNLDIFNLPYSDKSQVNVICIQVLQHLPYYDDALNELLRITSKKLYISSWFTSGPEDRLVLSEPSPRWDYQTFQNNCYSLPKFIAYITDKSDRPIKTLQTHHFSGQNYSISLTFA